MARIAGVDLPKDKKIEIALTYIFGIGPSSAKKILDEAGIDPNVRSSNLTETDIVKIRAILDRDYTVEGDYLGPLEVVVFVGNLAMLEPNIVARLHAAIKEFPGWQIVMTVAVRGHYDDWPDMGLYIRPHEIVDGLQRQYFPEEFQYLNYEGSRRGGAYD